MCSLIYVCIILLLFHMAADTIILMRLGQALIIIIIYSASYYERMKYCKSDTVKSHINLLLLLYYNKMYYNKRLNYVIIIS